MTYEILCEEEILGTGQTNTKGLEEVRIIDS
jgi:hypothetical protein